MRKDSGVFLGHMFQGTRCGCETAELGKRQRDTVVRGEER